VVEINLCRLDRGLAEYRLQLAVVTALSGGQRAVDAREDVLDRCAHGAEQRDGNDRDQTGDQRVFDHRHALVVTFKIANKTKHVISLNG